MTEVGMKEVSRHTAEVDLLILYPLYIPFVSLFLLNLGNIFHIKKSLKLIGNHKSPLEGVWR